MESSSSSRRRRPRPASFFTQANALLRKNLSFQKRNKKTNIGIIAFPLFLCVLLFAIQSVVNRVADIGGDMCGDPTGLGLFGTCPSPSPPSWPSLLQIPRPEYRAAASEPCRAKGSCPATLLFTGSNRSLAESLTGNFFAGTPSLNATDYLATLANVVPGTDAPPGGSLLTEPAITTSRPLYVIQSQCVPDSTYSLAIELANQTFQKEVKCVQGSPQWRASSSAINQELFKGYQQGNAEKKINEFIAAYDFSNTNDVNFDVSIWYNATLGGGSANSKALLRVPRSLNMVSNAFIQYLRGTDTMMQIEYVKEMPQPGTKLRLDFSSLLGPLFFTWVIQLLFPVILTYLVYEKQKKLKIMMKMHGLKEGPYWMISYAYFLLLSSVYMLSFVIFGSFIGLKFFTLNDNLIQLMFYSIYINLQIALAFLTSTLFSDVKTATVVAYIYVFGSGLLGEFFLKYFIEDTSFPRVWVLVMEMVPGFSLYRGLYEFGQYSFNGNYMGTSGMQWEDLTDGLNGMMSISIIMAIEWLVMLPIAYRLDQVSSSGGRSKGGPQKPSSQQDASNVFIEMDRPDVALEREVVEQLLLEPNNSHAIVCDNLKKVYPGRDGNPEKFAVRGLSLALARGECFGMLGPNGAGKTSFINMMIGLTTPTSGNAYVQGLDILTNMNRIYTSMGVCPQHDLLWETLTGREHLLFYGRLKNLKGAALTQAVNESLKSVNLFSGGVGDKQAGKYSGGMKRRLSVAISLIGDPKVVYMDEPSTGLDPASRNDLWNVVTQAKRNRAIILTTHSMEEAEVLCDRLGIFVDGRLQCIGNANELKARYGGTYVLTVTTSSNEEEAIEVLVRGLSPSAVKIYQISGTQKFEMPKQEVRIADVFRAVEAAKRKLVIYAWGLVDTTLEDVFIKVAKGALESSDELS
ncbi:ABC transporter A family member 7-like isoform X1 [Iris pallida]|uniref:ABC transporter A family member 7-like isoform X1 n=1 Tax=Iris pallida TaxID=29817 RepID=A0AAX6EWE5_IRIPA|nr:ABC transporter A family member 7-like isoform X1 [Iris pallida]